MSAGRIIQLSLRRDTAANWTTTDPVLAEGEKGLETDTKYQKIGDGVTAWTALPYWHGPPWIDNIGGGAPDSAYPGAPFNPHGIMSTAPFIPPPPPIVLGTSPDWFSMQVLGRGPNANEIAFVGSETGATIDLGILNTDTNVITVTSDPWSGIPINVSSGIDTDRSTGIMVVHRRNSIGNTYQCYWADVSDLTTWTLCASPSTAFHGGAALFFDENQGIWYWSTGVTCFTSTDGKTFVQQTMEYVGFGTFNAPVFHNYLHSGFFTPTPNQSFMGANSERLVMSNPVAASVPIPVGVLGQFLEGYSLSSGGIITSGNPSWLAGCCYFEGAVYMASSNGEIIKSTLGTQESWTVVAADQAGSDSSEMIDDAFIHYFFTVIEGVFWFTRDDGGAGKWFRYGTGGEPVGYGWVQDDTGPFGITTINGTTESSRLMRVPDQRYAYCGAETVGINIPFHIYYDINS